MKKNPFVSIAKLLYTIFSSRRRVGFREIDIHDRILVTSDLHLFKPFNQEIVGSFLLRNGIRTLIILGDLFDDLRRPLGRSELAYYLKLAMKKLALPQKTIVHYILSKSSHDPLIVCDSECTIELDHVDVHVHSRPILIRNGAEKIYCTHGDEYIRSGFLAYLINLIARYGGEELLIEKLSKKRLVDRDAWFIMGHTHMPGIDYNAKVANTGGWGSPIRKRIGYLITIDGHSVEFVDLSNLSETGC